MFVPHKPNLSLDVYRNTDRCVCGASAVNTCHNGENSGYCSECAKKREEFVKENIGNIFVGNEESLEFSVLNILENIRISTFEERINYMINKFFANQQDSNYKKLNEPYEDEIFIRNLSYEKIDMIKKFIHSISETNTKNSSKKINKIIKYYIEELNNMLISERDRVDELNAKLGGYSYEKRKA